VLPVKTRRCPRIVSLVALAGLCSGALAAAEEATKEPESRPSSLHFTSGDYLAGRLLDSPDPGSLNWHSDAFRGPLSFPVGAVQSIQFHRAIEPRIPGPYCFELAGGDVLYGSLAALDERELTIETGGLGTLHLDQAIVHRLYRTGAKDLIFSGPGGLAGWETAGPTKAWRDDGGQLRTDQPDATLRRAFSLPPLVRYELELSWSALPNFEFAIGIDKTRPTVRPAFKLETWGDELVIVRESERHADFCSLQKLSPGAGQIHFQVLFDQKQGKLLVLSPTGEKLADLTVPEDKGAQSLAAKARPLLFKLPLVALAPVGGVQLANRRGDIKLQRLTISRWSGQAPELPAPGKAWLHQTDGTSRSVELRSYDAAERQFELRENDADLRLDESQVDHIVLSQPGPAASRMVRLLLTTGERISGDLLKIEDGRVFLRCPGVREPLSLPIEELHSLFVLRHDDLKVEGNSPPNPSPEGRLELDGVSLHGRLISAQAIEPACLVFQPRHATAAKPLAAGISGRLVYREPPPPKPTPPQPTPQQQTVRVLNGVRTLLGARFTPAARPAAPGDCVLHLRSGDTLACRVQRIDEQGVWFKSTQSTADFVPHAKIKAVELRQDLPPVKIDKTKADRLLTLPRMQRDNPPEHLIRSLDGDYLRGRLLAMDDRQLHVECRLETRSIDRTQVARIIWLHSDEMARPADPSATLSDSIPKSQPAGVRVQAVPRDGRRLTFFVQRFENQMLIGQSDVLGDCRVSFDQIDQLLFGSAIEQSAASLAFHQWKLHPAPDPLPTPEEGAEPNASEGLESVLVGKPAPPIELDLLGGKKFSLADYKNKVVVLDFWASWCGPCLQTMPQVDQVAREFAEQGVHLVAINLEEAPERIQTALERLKLEVPVALDRDGRVAERYGATSIPQTVIIDRAGNVARLFVGGSPRFDAVLRQALQSVLDVAPDQKSD